MLQQAMGLSAAQAPAAASDDDLADYNNELRMGILEAYSGLFQGLPAEVADARLRGDAPAIVDFANSIARDPVRFGALCVLLLLMLLMCAHCVVRMLLLLPALKCHTQHVLT